MNGNNTVLTVVVIVLVVVVGWLVYRKGFADNQQDVEVNLPVITKEGY